MYCLSAGVLVYILARMFGGKHSGRGGPGRRHKRSDASSATSGVQITFADVAGVDEAKEELQEIVVGPFSPQALKTTKPDHPGYEVHHPARQYN